MLPAEVAFGVGYVDAEAHERYSSVEGDDAIGLDFGASLVEQATQMRIGHVGPL